MISYQFTAFVGPSKFATEGVVIGDMTQEQFAELIRQEIKRYAVVVKVAKLTSG